MIILHLFVIVINLLLQLKLIVNLVFLEKLMNRMKISKKEKNYKLKGCLNKYEN